VILSGRVQAFDELRGDGVLSTGDGTAFYFHCVNIADGSRSVNPGQRVLARRGVGHLGHDEAFAIEKIDGD
jgi:cold shock CspA family protein